jgi:hypothetical protein
MAKNGLDFRLALAFGLLLCAVALFSSVSKAEYRAYELKIENPETGSERKAISTLDQIQYPRYFPLNPGERVKYVDSWMCRGNTSQFKAICPKPERSPTKGPGV